MKPRVTVTVDLKCDFAALTRAIALIVFLLT